MRAHSEGEPAHTGKVPLRRVWPPRARRHSGSHQGSTGRAGPSRRQPGVTRSPRLQPGEESPACRRSPRRDPGHRHGHLATGTRGGKPRGERSLATELERATQCVTHRRADDHAGGPLHPLHRRRLSVPRRRPQVLSSPVPLRLARPWRRRRVGKTAGRRTTVPAVSARQPMPPPPKPPCRQTECARAADYRPDHGTSEGTWPLTEGSVPSRRTSGSQRSRPPAPLDPVLCGLTSRSPTVRNEYHRIRRCRRYGRAI